MQVHNRFGRISNSEDFDPNSKLERDTSRKLAKKCQTHSCFFQIVAVFSLFFLFRCLSAIWNNINDCDETYNYWEPAHFLIFKNGFQTWEYSPKYAIRSYAYLWLYIWPTKILAVFNYDLEHKVSIFYLIRFYMAFLCALSETFLFFSIRKVFSLNNAIYFGLASMFSAGMFLSSTSFLPSSFAIYIVCLSFALWLDKNYRLFIFLFAFGSFLSWPFIGLIGLPIALNLVFVIKSRFLIYSLISTIIILVPTIIIDSYYYGKLIFAALNIVLYNVFSSHGPNIYGVEPLSYYFLNLFLNFNVFFLISSISFPVLLITLRQKKSDHTQQVLVNLSLHLWYFIFFLQPHKEERFMYPIYPLISMSVSFTLTNLEELLSKKLKSYFKVLVKLSYILFFGLSISRILALYNGYNSSMTIYHRLYKSESILKSQNQTTIVCIGKEWHRFPSNFFIPKNFRIEFVLSEFRGQLPKHFDRSATYPTRIIPTDMNDLNKEEISRYVDPIRQCHLLIDTDYNEFEPRDYPYSKDQSNWLKFFSLKYLDTTKSPKLLRSFYVPFLHELKCLYIDYNLLKNRKLY